MSSFLSLALRFNRTLVIKPETFNRATQACRDLGQGNNLECYFFPLGAPACLQVALAAEAKGEVVNSDGVAMEERERILASDAVVVQVANTGLFGEVGATDLWGAPSLDRPFSIQQLGRIQGQYFAWGQARWWRSQALRFMLRWPSLHLCHATNRMRHSAYGLLVADRVVSFALKQADLLQALNASAAAAAAAAAAGSASSTVPPASSSSSSSSSPTSQYPSHMHVRQGDKGIEMSLHSLASFVFFAYRMRRHRPDLQYIWLSSEMEVRR
ncbi:unnamed protein product [Closterium sp. Yama58-4]|nr:unnamed protein product [Closterium sp. Yama58-4]